MGGVSSKVYKIGDCESGLEDGWVDESSPNQKERDKRVGYLGIKRI